MADDLEVMFTLADAGALPVADDDTLAGLLAAGTSVFRTIHHDFLRPLEGEQVSDQMADEVQWAELVVRGAFHDQAGPNDLDPRQLKYRASDGRPLGICTGPAAVEWATGKWVAPPSDFGCRTVFVQASKRHAFPVWCPTCNKLGQPPQRAKRTLTDWSRAVADWREQRDPAALREAEHLVRVHERRDHA